MEFEDSPNNPYESPQERRSSAGDEALATIIPYKNSPALIAYYLGLFSLSACIPLLGIIGLIMSITAVVLGIKGLKRAAESPEARGRIHAWIGIIGGTLCLIVGGIINVAVIIAMIAAAAEGRL